MGYQFIKFNEMNVLIVEDEKLARNALRHSVEELGHCAFVAETAEDAIREVETRQIDFILSDILMPGIGGLSLVSVLRNIHLVKIPIVHISALDNEQVRAHSRQMGADDFISKPFTITEIAEVMEKHAKRVA